MPTEPKLDRSGRGLDSDWFCPAAQQERAGESPLPAPVQSIHARIAASRRARISILLAGVLLSQLILYGPALLGMKILLPLDLLTQPGRYIPSSPETAKIVARDSVKSDWVELFEPERVFVATELRAGRWPMWIPGQYAGRRVIQSTWLSPLSLLLVSTPSPVVLAWHQLLAALLAAVGFYLFCRRALGVGFWPATLTAWCYPMIGFLIMWFAFPISAPVFWLPWLLLAVHGVLGKPTWPAACALGIVTAIMLSGRHVDIAGQALLFSGAYAIGCLLSRYRKRLFSKEARTAVVLLLAGWLLGVSLAAPPVLSLGEYALSSDRVPRRVAGEEDRPPGDLSALRLLALPDANGATADGAYMISAPFQIESMSAGYAGALSLLFFAPLAWRNRRHRAPAVVFAASLYVAVAWNANIGGIVLLLRLPLLNLMSHNRFVFVAAFSILAMAAMGMESLREPSEPGLRRWYRLPAILTAGLAIWCFYRAWQPQEPIATELEKLFREGKATRWIHSAADIGRIRSWFFGVYLVGGVLAGLGATGWLLLSRLARWRWWLTALAGTAMFLDMLWFAHDRIPNSDPDLYYPRVAMLEQLAAKTAGRIIGVTCLPAGIAQMAGLRDVRGYDGLDPSRYVRMLRRAQPEGAASNAYALVQWMSPTVEKLAPDRVKLSPVLDMLGVEYAIFRGSPPPGFSPPFIGADYWALRNPSALPRVFVPRRVEIVPDEKVRLEKLRSPQFDPWTVAFLEVPVEVPQSIRGRARILGESPTEVTIEVTMETAGVVVLADRWDDGWRARLDGEPVPILIANHALRAVRVPAGTSKLSFRYQPTSIRLGLVLFGLATMVMAVGLVVGRRRGRLGPSEAKVRGSEHEQ